MAGSARSWSVLGLLTGAVLLQPAACGKADEDPVSKTVRAALVDLWPEVVAPALVDTTTDAARLEAATLAWAEAPADPAARLAAQDAWFELMESWQRAELLQIGPIGSSLTTTGGLDLRDNVYSWPTTNPCRVDQEVVEENWNTADFFEVELVNVTGLDALETLLFSGDENSCPPQVGINADGTWDALGPDGIAALRADYSVALSAQILVELKEMQQAWDPSGDNFSEDISSAGEPGSSYETADSGLNAILDGLFYLETRTKDRKLAEPLGLRDCGATNCLSVVETPVAGGSNTWIAANLVGFRRLWLGGEGTGLDDVLREVGEDALADQLLAALDEADAAAAALTVPVDVAATTDPTDALALHAAIAAVTDLLKGDVATVLLLQLPDEAAGDND